MMTTESLNTAIVVSFMFGMMSSVRINIGYVYLVELMPKSWHSTTGSIFNVFEGSIYVIASVYFWFLSKNWLYFVSVGYIFSLISACAIWLLPESPSFLIEKQRLEEAHLCL